jgi:hypothetical protein
MRMSGDKLRTKDLYWFVEMICDSRWLVEVSTTGPEDQGVDMLLHIGTPTSNTRG